MNKVKSINHRIRTYEINISLACFNEKMYILDNVVDTLDLTA